MCESRACHSQGPWRTVHEAPGRRPACSWADCLLGALHCLLQVTACIILLRCQSAFALLVAAGQQPPGALYCLLQVTVCTVLLRCQSAFALLVAAGQQPPGALHCLLQEAACTVPLCCLRPSVQMLYYLRPGRRPTWGSSLYFFMEALVLNIIPLSCLSVLFAFLFAARQNSGMGPHALLRHTDA